jgi:NAD(P)-dependent dehydrogenase (short-subunit alcohol dehydrogenase family)
MDFCSLKGKNFIVTGASSGLGQATSILLSELGAKVCLIGRDEVRLNNTLSQMNGSGHIIKSFDLSITEDVQSLIPHIVQSIGSISGLAHFAGIRSTLPLKVLKPEHLEKIMKVNFYSFVELVRQITNKRTNLDLKGCSFVVASSVAAIRGIPAMTAYASSKAAIDATVRSLAIELASRNIRINSLQPGYVDTPMNQEVANQLTEEQMQAICNQHPLGIGQPKDIANVTAFLLADESKWITGVSLPIDGGFLIRS